MRIVAGSHRGRTLVAPKGHSTRPTADRTRQAIFNVLEHAAWAPALQGAPVLDLFAGSGALGLEALSRGAAICLFVDNDRAAREAIALNLIALGLSERGHIVSADARRPLPARDGGFDLAFLDPPYGDDAAAEALGALASPGVLRDGAVVVLERAADDTSPLPAPFRLIDERRWGAARVAFLQIA